MVVDAAESSTSNDGIGEGGNGFDAAAYFLRADGGSRRNGSHSLDGLGEVGHRALLASTLGSRRSQLV